MQEFVIFALPSMLVAAVSYLLGSISFSILFTKLFCGRKDIRTLGSGNAGLTNVLRCVGVKAGILTFIFDFSKGAASVLIGRTVFQHLCLQYHLPEYFIQYGAYLAGIACVVGHIYPLYFHFRGGKGVLASAAIIAFLDWRYFLIAVSIFAVVFFFTRIVSISSICGALSFPLINFLFSYFRDCKPGAAPLSYVWITTAFSMLFAGLLVYKHRANLERLKNGTEKKFSIKHS
ncbi:glycerol-3-phosphate 1-O-acyltransferase PlsY [Caproicibacter sp.]|uniref:glycerol-3-phosphate 1-O-acyltransferase PlsY n=1 Tax=Caproicibacter sp. TaxID=2814884 RepID=UPI00398A183E